MSLKETTGSKSLPQQLRDYILDNYELCYDDFVYCKKKNNMCMIEDRE